MRRIGSRHRAVKTELSAMRIDPMPDSGSIAIRAGHIDRLAMTIASGPVLSSMQRIAGACLETRRDALAVVVAERAQEGPADTGLIHRAAGVIKLFAEVGVHAADHICRHGKAEVLGGVRILPREIAAPVPLGGGALIYLPQIIVDFMHDRGGALWRRCNRGTRSRDCGLADRAGNHAAIRLGLGFGRWIAKLRRFKFRSGTAVRQGDEAPRKDHFRFLNYPLWIEIRGDRDWRRNMRRRAVDHPGAFARRRERARQRQRYRDEEDENSAQRPRHHDGGMGKAISRYPAEIR